MFRSHRIIVGSASIMTLVLAACSAGEEGGVFDGSEGGNGGAGIGGTAQTGGSGGMLSITTGTGATGNTGTTCETDPAVDDDLDGFTEGQNDCNDCDANVNPGAIEVAVEDTGTGGGGGAPDAADEDCDGMVDNVAGPCDTGLLLEDTDPLNAARAIELCQQVGVDGKDWGVVSATWVRANGGTTGIVPQKYGIQTTFGTNVNPQGGERLVALSSGNARTVGQAGACNTYQCYSGGGGTAPAGFPQDVPGCPGLSNIYDDIGLEVAIKAPSNATGYSFNFKFYSFEYPEWVCTSYNDQFIALVTPPPTGSIAGNISFDSMSNPVSVNVAFFDVCAGCPLGLGDMANTGFDAWGNDAGGTGWLATSAPIAPGEQISIRWAIWDTGDEVWDSSALVDNFEWVANGGSVVVGTEPVPTPK